MDQLGRVPLWEPRSINMLPKLEKKVSIVVSCLSTPAGLSKTGGGRGSNCSISSERPHSKVMSSSVSPGRSCRSKAAQFPGPYCVHCHCAKRGKCTHNVSNTASGSPPAERSPKPSSGFPWTHAPQASESPASALARASATGSEAGFAASSAKWVAIVCRLGSVVMSSPLFKGGFVEYLFKLWDVLAVHGALQMLKREGKDQSMLRLVKHLGRTGIRRTSRQPEPPFVQ